MKTITSVRTSVGQVVLTAITNGSAQLPKIEIYDGTMPASMGLSITDTLLAEMELTATAGTVTAGVLTFDAITDDLEANANGTPGWARILDRDGAEVHYITVTGTGAGGELQLSSASLQAGSPVVISSASIAMGS